MSVHRTTFYTDRTGWRQWRVALVSVALLGLAGCGHISFPMGKSSESDASSINTGSVASMSDPRTDRDVAVTDRGIIASTLATAPETQEPTPTQLAWANPETGNQGTIFEVVDADPKAAGSCRRFSTTANTIDGVRAYSGIACPDSFDKWHVTVLQPADAGA
ncbi:outer membrane surface antigen [Breoghania corrubedonensis]|uniref:Outer membrane surface antigen n=1 Tax=Breoghania corrubedonensis TaxID=665038 RepID=A0A2T5VEH7_9HYPH|nr:RT0821/Lpp0805 family surface protein [Breoghania corrubedonensis]PTW62162.1 outer membrane surface antigen [Breoghania corrubedonensis]